ncbi:XRE family transcriptional regulator [Allohahella marinimesophila]|uniref:XRE family transcriptional regulator n=1 Tax=Allohahella marinimesophila TaxID=1054972 RepID=A0ABP7P901_9GAMM
MIGERLKRARAASGLSMSSLGDLAGVSANMIKKYEHNLSMPSSGVLIKLSSALGVKSEYFFRQEHVQLLEVEYRKRASASRSLLKKVEADVLDQAERWQELANLWPNFPIKPFKGVDGLTTSVETLEEAEEVADRIRESWGLGKLPLSDLIDVLETHGILVIVTDVDSGAKFDGLQASVAGQPVVVVSSTWPGDRQRFTLAHELGHLLLSDRLASEIDEEKACNRFASALLLPAASVRQHLGEKRSSLEPRELALLKQEFGVSMAACLYRAADLGIIDRSTCQKMYIVFSQRGWRKQEPGPALPQEQTLLFQQLVYRALGEDIIGEAKAAELLKLPLMSFHQIRKMESSHSAAHQ